MSTQLSEAERLAVAAECAANASRPRKNVILGIASPADYAIAAVLRTAEHRAKTLADATARAQRRSKWADMHEEKRVISARRYQKLAPVEPNARPWKEVTSHPAERPASSVELPFQSAYGKALPIGRGSRKRTPEPVIKIGDRVRLSTIKLSRNEQLPYGGSIATVLSIDTDHGITSARVQICARNCIGRRPIVTRQLDQLTWLALGESRPQVAYDHRPEHAPSAVVYASIYGEFRSPR